MTTFLANDRTEVNEAVSSLKHSAVPELIPDALSAAMAFFPASVFLQPTMNHNQR